MAKSNRTKKDIYDPLKNYLTNKLYKFKHITDNFNAFFSLKLRKEIHKIKQKNHKKISNKNSSLKKEFMHPLTYLHSLHYST